MLYHPLHFALLNDKSVEPYGGPSSDGSIGWYNIAGMVGGGGHCLDDG